MRDEPAATGRCTRWASRLPVLLAVALGAWSVPAGQATAADLFVDAAVGSDGADGLSWTTARLTVGSALATAAASPEADVISVAAGRYREQVVVPADVALLGGFPSGGGGRDPAANPTTLDGAGLPGSVVHFPPGSDGTSLEGFTITGGEGTLGPEFVTYGGGIFIEDAAPVIRDNVIEGNHACRGAGVTMIYSGASPGARVERNLIRRNGYLPMYPRECERGVWPFAGNLFVSAPPGVDLGTVLSGGRISGSLGAESVQLAAQCAIEHVVIEDDLAPILWLSGGPVTITNVAITGIEARVVLLCGGNYSLRNVTWTGTSVLVQTLDAPAPTPLTIEDSILWGGVFDPGWTCGGSGPAVTSSIVQGGFLDGVNVLDADPLFAPGPAGAFYLSQVAAGQAVTSPAVDAGGRTAVAAGLDQHTTATDSASDAGTVDLGYHPERVPSLTILRGTGPSLLAVHRVVASLPFLDDPGTLNDPTLRVLFYRVPEAENDILVDAEPLTDAVRLAFRGAR